jgi:glyoxylate carboligase
LDVHAIDDDHKKMAGMTNGLYDGIVAGNATIQRREFVGSANSFASTAAI